MKKLPLALFSAAALLAMWASLALGPRDARAQQVGLLACSQNAIYDASTNGATRLVAAATGSSRQIYLCGYTLNVGAVATNVALKYGTGTACATGTTALTPTFVLPAAGQVREDASAWRGLTVPAGNDLCLVTSAGNPVQGIVYFTYQ